MLKQISTQNQKGGGMPTTPNPKLSAKVVRKHSSRSCWRRLAQSLRQRVGRCTGKPEIEKAEIAKPEPT